MFSIFALFRIFDQTDTKKAGLTTESFQSLKKYKTLESDRTLAAVESRRLDIVPADGGHLGLAVVVLVGSLCVYIGRYFPAW